MLKQKALIVFVCLTFSCLALPAAAEPCCWHGYCTSEPEQLPDRCLYFYDASEEEWCSCTCEYFAVEKYCELVFSANPDCDVVIIPLWWIDYYLGVCAAEACGEYQACSNGICFNLSGQDMGRTVKLWAICIQPE